MSTITWVQLQQTEADFFIITGNEKGRLVVLRESSPVSQGVGNNLRQLGFTYYEQTSSWMRFAKGLKVNQMVSCFPDGDAVKSDVPISSVAISWDVLKINADRVLSERQQLLRNVRGKQDDNNDGEAAGSRATSEYTDGLKGGVVAGSGGRDSAAVSITQSSSEGRSDSGGRGGINGQPEGGNRGAEALREPEGGNVDRSAGGSDSGISAVGGLQESDEGKGLASNNRSTQPYQGDSARHVSIGHDAERTDPLNTDEALTSESQAAMVADPSVILDAGAGDSTMSPINERVSIAADEAEKADAESYMLGDNVFNETINKMGSFREYVDNNSIMVWTDDGFQQWNLLDCEKFVSPEEDFEEDYEESLVAEESPQNSETSPVVFDMFADDSPASASSNDIQTDAALDGDSTLSDSEENFDEGLVSSSDEGSVEIVSPLQEIDEGKVNYSPKSRGVDSEYRTLSKRYEDNLATLQILNKKAGDLTDEDLAALSSFSGWGGLLERLNKEGAKEELGLDRERFAHAKESSLTAFYTPNTVAKEVWDLLEKKGYRGGRALDMGAGTGIFLQERLSQYDDNQHFTAIEKERVSGNILKALYPAADVHVSPMENVYMLDNSFDLVIGNFPFGEISVHDPEIPNTLSIHNYCLQKSLNKLAVGGITAAITSTFTLDSKNPSFRESVAKQADLLHAVRLPGAIFGSAHTSVMSDLLIFRKRESDTPYNGIPFVEMGELDTTAKRKIDVFKKKDDAIRAGEYVGVPINEAFLYGNGGILAGNATGVGDRFGDGVVLDLEGDKDGGLEAIRSIAGQSQDMWFDEKFVLSDAVVSEAQETERRVYMSGDLIVGALILSKDSPSSIGSIRRVGKEEGRRFAMVGDVDVPKTQVARVSAMIGLKESIYEQLVMESSNKYTDETIEGGRKALNGKYDNFVSKYDILNSKANRKWINADASASVLLGVELYDHGTKKAEKADIFFKRVSSPRQELTSASNLSEAAALAFSSTGEITPERVSSLMGKPFDEIIADEPDVIFKSPETNAWVVKGQLLTGNVRKRLRMAEILADSDPQMVATRDILETNQPHDIPIEDIGVSLSSPWMNSDHRESYALELLSRHGVTPNHLSIISKHGGFDVELSVSGSHAYGVVSEVLGTKDRGFKDLLDAACNNKVVRITQKTEDGGNILMKEETLAAQSKLDDIKDGFFDWVMIHPNVSEDILKDFNEKVNKFAYSDYSMPDYQFQGLSPMWTPREHQSDFVVRSLMTGNSLAAHGVGAGKTMEMVMLAYEYKRLGMAKKPIISVPNNILGDVAAKAYSFYPNAKIAVISKDDMTGAAKSAMISRVALNNWDLVIAPHSVMDRVAAPDDFRLRFEEATIDKIAEAYQNSGATDRRVELSIKKAKTDFVKLKEKLEERKSPLTLAHLGVDCLLVDEADLYKNLKLDMTSTVPGVSDSASNKAWNLFMQTEYLKELRQGETGVHFFTGTPISNSVAELYTVTRYLKQSIHEDAGIYSFNDWVNTFGKIVTELEMLPEGGGFHMKSRLSNFQNIPELGTLFRIYADVKTREDLPLPVPTHAETVITADQSEWQDVYLSDLTVRAKDVRSGTVDTKDDNLLKIVGNGRRAAMDMRLIDPRLPKEEENKLSLASKKIADIYHETADDKLTQMVFCDVSTPSKPKSLVARIIESVDLQLDDMSEKEVVKDRAKHIASIYQSYLENGDVTEEVENFGLVEFKKSDISFDAYTESRQQLIEQGVVPSEIAFIHDYDTDAKRDALFAQVNKGDIRVLFGSTSKLGAGTNAQERLYALHNLDAPWRPRDLEQRLGRIVRQGNTNPHVYIYNYTTADSFDLFMWETNKRKAKGIAVMMRDPKKAERKMEESQEINFAEVVAITTKDPAIREKTEVDAEVEKLRRKETQYYAMKNSTQMQFKQAERTIERSAGELDRLKDIASDIRDKLKAFDAGQGIPIVLYGKIKDFQSGDTSYLNSRDGAKALNQTLIDTALFKKSDDDEFLVGEVLGQKVYGYLSLDKNVYVRTDISLSGSMGKQISDAPHITYGRIIDEVTRSVPDKINKLTERMADAKEFIAKTTLTDEPFPQQQELIEKKARQTELDAHMMMIAAEQGEEKRIEMFPTMLEEYLADRDGVTLGDGTSADDVLDSINEALDNDDDDASDDIDDGFKKVALSWGM